MIPTDTTGGSGDGDEWDSDDYEWADEDTVDYTDDSNDESGLTSSDDGDDDDDTLDYDYSDVPDRTDDNSPTETIQEVDEQTGTDTDAGLDGTSDSDIVEAYQETSDGTGVTDEQIENSLSGDQPDQPQNEPVESPEQVIEQAAATIEREVDLPDGVDGRTALGIGVVAVAAAFAVGRGS